MWVCGAGQATHARGGLSVRVSCWGVGVSCWGGMHLVGMHPHQHSRLGPRLSVFEPQGRLGRNTPQFICCSSIESLPKRACLPH